MQVTKTDIREHIDTDFKEYSMYVIQQRGIPNFYDSLTPVQRLVLQHAPDRFQTTVALVGHVMATGLYHHGDQSLVGAINKLARPFGCSRRMLVGDGFFGSPVNPKPASSRYTKVRSDQKTSELINRYKPLNVTNHEGGHDWLHVDLPIALCTHTVGIAVGYASNILPRKMEDVDEYLDGKKKLLYPHFDGFGGKVVRYPGRDNGWIFEGVFAWDDDKMQMRIGDLPPLLKYTTFVQKLNKKLDLYGSHYGMMNNSKKTVDILIKWKNRESWTMVRDAVRQCTKVACMENLVFVKDGRVVQYDCIHDYLDEFRLHRERVILKKMQHDIKQDNQELAYLRAKLLFLRFMMERKRQLSEIKTFIAGYGHETRRRLDSIKLTQLAPETATETERQIAETERQIAEREELTAVQLTKCRDLEQGFTGRGRVRMDAVTELFEPEVQSVDGVEVFDHEAYAEEEWNVHGENNADEFDDEAITD